MPDFRAAYHGHSEKSFFRGRIITRRQKLQQRWPGGWNRVLNGRTNWACCCMLCAIYRKNKIICWELNTHKKKNASDNFNCKTPPFMSCIIERCRGTQKIWFLWAARGNIFKLWCKIILSFVWKPQLNAATCCLGGSQAQNHYNVCEIKKAAVSFVGGLKRHEMSGWILTS